MAGGKQQPKSDEKPEDLSGFAKDGMDKTEFSDPEANTGAAELDQYDATEGETTQLENQETSEETMEEAEDALELIKSEWWEDPTPGDISIDQNELSQIIQKYMDAASYQARTYEEILSGKLSPNETMFYEVNKFDKNSKLVQRIFLPVMPYTAEFATEYGGIMKQYVSYLDTQVKYGKFYRYEIFAWQLVVGTKYFYRRLAKEQYKGLGNIIPGLQSIRSNFELAFQKYKELMQSGFTYYKDGDFPKFEAEITQFYNSINGFSTGLTGNTQSTWLLEKYSPDGFDNALTNTSAVAQQGFLTILWNFFVTPYTVNAQHESAAKYVKWLVDNNKYTRSQLLYGMNVFGELLDMLEGEGNSYRGISENKIVSYNIDDIRNAVAGPGVNDIEMQEQNNPLFRLYRSFGELYKNRYGQYTSFGDMWGGSFAHNLYNSEYWTYQLSDGLVDHYKLQIVTGGDAAEQAGYKPNALKTMYNLFRNAYECAELPDEPDDGIIKFDFEVVTEATPKILRAPFYTSKIYVIDHLPVSPIVEIVPYKGVNDKLLFMFQQPIDHYFAPPVAIEEKDQAIFDLIREELKREAKNTDLFEFKTEKEYIDEEWNDEIKAQKASVSDLNETYGFEVFRLGPVSSKEQRPSKYSDFAGKKIGLVKAGQGFSFIDETIQPNNRYYYTFRSIDVHGNVSNPTNVFEVELVDDFGLVYLLTKPYDIYSLTEQAFAGYKNMDKRIVLPGYKIENKKSDSKSAKKLLQITPALSQLAFDESGHPKSTFSAGGVQARHFKARVTSKNSAKKLDLNIEVKINGLNLDDYKDKPKDFMLLPDVPLELIKGQATEGETTVNAGHAHTFTVDENGNGTAHSECHPDFPWLCHSHIIKNGIIYEAGSKEIDPVNGVGLHKHQLPKDIKISFGTE